MTAWNNVVTEMFILEVLSGPLDGKSWRFEREITIGRDASVAACITLDRYVSRRHACVREEGDGLVLADLASRNGTRTADGTLSTETPILLGEKFVVGRTALRVIRA